MKIKHSVIYTAIFALGLCSLYSCVNHDLGDLDSELTQPFVVECDGTKSFSYANDIVPIINSNCTFSGCHDGASGPPNWKDYNTLKDHVSEVQRRITLPLSDPDKMPREGSITAEERQTLYCWIEQGALQN